MADRVKSAIILPPVGGINSKDSLITMAPEYAIDLLNFFPTGSTLDFRRGMISGCTTQLGNSITGSSLFEYARVDGGNSLVSVTSDAGVIKVYSISAGVATDITGAGTLELECYSVCFRDRIFLKAYSPGNTTDVYVWTGAGNIALAAFAGPGGDDKALWKMTSYKKRLYFIGKDASFWYGAEDAVTGALTQFDLQSVFKRGGSLIHIDSFSISDSGVNEYFVAISSNGEILLYQGLFPGDVTWSLVGRFFGPRPIGRKSFFNWGSDIVIISYEGVIALSDILSSRNQSNFIYLSDKFLPTFKNLITSNVSNLNEITGVYYPNGPYLCINFPYNLTSSGTYLAQRNSQAIMNTITKAWTVFNYRDVQAISRQGDSLFFLAGAGPLLGTSEIYLAQANTGDFDSDLKAPSTTVARNAKIQTAYTYLGDPGRRKIFTNLRPIVYEGYGLDLIMDVNVDYDNQVVTNQITDLTYTGSDPIRYRPLIDVLGEGKAVSVRLNNLNADTQPPIDYFNKYLSIEAIEIFWKDGGSK